MDTCGSGQGPQGVIDGDGDGDGVESSCGVGRQVLNRQKSGGMYRGS